MEFIYLKQFFTEYSVSTILVAGIVGLVFILLDKTLKNVPKIIKSYLPVMLSLGVTLLIEYIKNPNNFDLTESIILGLLCGSLTLAFISFYKRRKSGDTNRYSILELTLLEILIGFTEMEKAKIIVGELKLINEEEHSLLNQKVEDVLNCHLKENVEAESMLLLKNLIASAILSLK